MKRIIGVVGILLPMLLTACGQVPVGRINYDPNKNTQQQFDSDLANCRLQSYKQFGAAEYVPGNFEVTCMSAKGWHK